MRPKLDSIDISDIKRPDGNYLVLPVEPENSDRALQRIFTPRQLCRTLSKSTLPLFIVGSIRTGEIFLMIVMISRIPKALPADGLVGIIFDFFAQTILDLLSPITPMIAEAHGAKKINAIRKIVQRGWIFSTLLSIPPTIIVYNSGYILELMGQDPTLIRIVTSYSRLSAFAILPIFWSAIDNSFLKGISKSHFIILSYLLLSAVGLSTTYFLTGSEGVSPEQRYKGVGYAILIQCWVNTIIVKICFCHKSFSEYKLFNFSRKSFRNLFKMLRVGSPLFFLSLSEQATNFVTGLMIGHLGSRQLALNQASSFLLQIVKAPIGGIRQGTQIYVSYFKGKKDYYNMRRFGNIGIALETGIYILPSIIMATIPLKIAQQFVSEEDIQDFETMLRWIFITKALSKILEGCRGAVTENLKGMLDNLYPTIVQLLINIVVIIPSSLLMDYVFGLDLIGINLGTSIGMAATIPFLLNRWYSMSSTIEQEAFLPERPNSLQILYQSEGQFPQDNQQQIPGRRYSDPILTVYKSKPQRSLIPGKIKHETLRTQSDPNIKRF